MSDKNCEALSYDLNNQGSFQCLAIAKTEEARDNYLKNGFTEFFTPERHGINCWILCKVESEVPT